MAEDKKSFVMYADLIHVIRKLVEQDRLNKTNYAGELFLHIWEYVNDNEPIPVNFIIDMAFEPIKQQLKRDLSRYSDKKVKFSEAGKKSAEAKRLAKIEESISTKSTNVENVEGSTTFSTVNVNDNVSVNVNDNVTVNDILLKKETKEDSNVISDELKIHLPTPKFDFDRLIYFFNENRGLLPEVKKLSEPRKKKILLLEKQYGKKSIQSVIEKIRDSPFLQGDNKENWTATFDWILNPTNFLKILEDNYARKQNTRSSNSSATDAEHKQSAVNAVNAMFGVQQ